MPPAVSRMHPSHMSNPFAHLNPLHSIPTSSHYQSQSASGHLPGHHAFAGASGLAGGFTPSSAYPSSTFPNSSIGGGVGGGQGLASVAAQQGFARGAAMQEQSHHAAEAQMGMAKGLQGRIREVWKGNLEQEMSLLRQLIQRYPYVSMDAEFPGIVARPIGNFAGSKAEYHYQTLRCNVDLLRPIQLGITLWTSTGELPPHQPDADLLNALKNTTGASNYANNNLFYCPCTWTFNFQFSLDDDMFASSSIELLKDSGVDFAKHAELGIRLEDFGSLLTSSGLTFGNSDVHWLSFHSAYDFAYLIKVLTSSPLPNNQAEFFELVRTFFPKLWDIKFLLRHAQRLSTQGRLPPSGAAVLAALGSRSGLQDLADELACSRVGAAHTGGSDSWLTGCVFWAMRGKMFDSALPEEMGDQIYGLHGVQQPASERFREEFLQAQQVGNATPQQQQQQQQQANGLGAYHAGHTPGQPSTPTTSHSGLSSQQTPGYGGYHGGNPGSLGAGGFGAFQYGK